MARADLLTDLVRFAMAGDKVRFRKVVEAIIAEERAKRHTVLANKLEGLLCAMPADRAAPNGASTVLEQKVSNLLQEVMPERSFDDLILPKEVLEISQEVAQEHHRIDLLRSYNLEPRNRLLLIGPPGNGKTSLAEAFAHALMVPLLIVRYEGVVGTYLGETAVRLHRLLEHARTRKCVLFFDEFETLGKERGDRHETGEIKRVVSSLLMQIDALPSHVVVIGATNHAELLDRAVWRRFQVRMTLPEPTRARLAEWFAKFEKRINLPLGYTPETMAKKLYGVNFAEAEEFGASVFRQYVLGQPCSDIKKIVDRTLKNWAARTVKAKPQNEGDE
ncbi:AAA family ATPase [Thioalkalivibrio sp. HK1]|uniref:AAA family ATPase n=1 Tax=Thioalkalivibrio sp. HK1 TaxID=1469245 RepID=UPI000471C1C3|nr:ATP-binding protein [Thioalkalivibrio sp. HK1]